MIRKILLLILLNVSIIFPQNLDSLLNLYVRIKTGQSYLPDKPGEQQNGKCVFGVMSYIKLNYNKFSQNQQAVISLYSARPSCDTSFVTPSGKFRLHYDLTGINKPGYNLNSLAAILDSVYNFEINFLGYAAPPADFGAGGDDLYDIYIENQSSDTYGYTDWEVNIGDSKYTSYLAIDNDYSVDYNTTGLNGARVTIAHEFHHAIQGGSYILNEDDTFYHEMTSTAMEEFMFDNVNDYIYYLKNFFKFPNYSFSSYSYSLGIWNMFLKERFGYDIIRRTWELMPTKRAIDAINTAIAENGSSFKDELNTFGVWTYYTGYRAISNKYFKDASKFPLISYITTINFISPLKTVSLNTKPATNNFVKFIYQTDTLSAIITNCDFVNAIDNVNYVLSCSYSLSSQSNGNFTKINNNFYYSFSSSNNSYFCVANVLNDSSSVISNDEDYFVYPQPFRYSNNNLFFPAKKNETNEAKLYVYTCSMDLIYQTKSTITAAGKPKICWNGYGFNGKLPSGVYLYVTDSDGEIIKGKFVIFND